MNKFRASITFGMILHLLFPGLGYIYWKEYTFGVFVFLIMLIASVLFFVSFLVNIPGTVIWLLLGLPTVFFLFSFFDLTRSIKGRQGKVNRSRGTSAVFFLLAIAFQFFAPNAPGNFMIRNAPEIFIMGNDRLEPTYRKGDVLITNPLAYAVDLFFLDRPVLRSLPDYFEAVRFDDASGRRITGIVVGLPGEFVEIQQGQLIVNSRPEFPRNPGSIAFGGDWPLTVTPENSILAATLNLGRVDAVHQVSLVSLTGKVNRLF